MPAILIGFVWSRKEIFCLCLCLLLTARFSLRAETPPAPVLLANGMQIVIRERHLTPLVAVDLWVRAGAREEKAIEFGSAHFLEHILFKGTTIRPPGQTDIDIENLGGMLNAATGPDYAHFYTTITASKVPQALEILSDLVQNARLAEAEITQERGVILDELAQHDSSPMAYLIDLLYAHALPDQAYGRSPGGSTQAIHQREKATLMAFYQRVYRPERAILTLAGDITPSQAEQWARQSFGAWMSSGNPPEHPGNVSVSIPLNSPLHFPSAHTSLLPERLTAYAPLRHNMIGIAFPAPPARNFSMTTAALLAAEIVANRALNTGPNSVNLYSGLEVSVHFTPRQDDSLWMVTAALLNRQDQQKQQDQNPNQKSNQKFNEPEWEQDELALRSLVLSLSKLPPTSSELAAAKRHLMAKMAADQETVAGLAAALGYAAITDAASPEAQAASILHFPAGELQQFVQHYLTQPALCIQLKMSRAGREEILK